MSLSTLADQVGAGCAVLEPLLRRVEAHVFAAERLHGDDTTVPVLAKGKTHHRHDAGSTCATIGRSAAERHRRRCSTTRAIAAASIVEAHLARWSGLLQADAYGGYNKLYAADRKPGPILEAACWAHARRPFFALADIEASARRKAEGKAPAPISPLALETVQRIDRLFEIERGINGKSADERRAVRQELSRPLVDELEAWMRAERPKLSRGSDLAKAMDYMLKRWPAFTRFLDDGRVCLSNNAAERGLRGIALGRKSWLFAGSDRGGHARRRHVQPDRHGQDERHRPAGLARRRARPHRRASGLAARRAAAVELAPGKRSRQPRRLKSAACGAHRMLTDRPASAWQVERQHFELQPISVKQQHRSRKRRDEPSGGRHFGTQVHRQCFHMDARNRKSTGLECLCDDLIVPTVLARQNPGLVGQIAEVDLLFSGKWMVTANYNCECIVK